MRFSNTKIYSYTGRGSPRLYTANTAVSDRNSLSKLYYIFQMCLKMDWIIVLTICYNLVRVSMCITIQAASFTTEPMSKHLMSAAFECALKCLQAGDECFGCEQNSSGYRLLSCDSNTTDNAELTIKKLPYGTGLLTHTGKMASIPYIMCTKDDDLLTLKTSLRFLQLSLSSPQEVLTFFVPTGYTCFFGFNNLQS